VLGAGLAAATIGALLLAVENHAGLGFAGRAAFATISIATAIVFTRHQQRVPEPLLPLVHLQDPVVRAGAIGSISPAP
jgi:hypothetical protein